MASKFIDIVLFLTLCNFMSLATSPLAGSKRARTCDQLLVAAQELLMEQRATSLGIRQVTTRAGMVHATFYNYFADIEALLVNLSALVFAAHAGLVAPFRATIGDPAMLFATITRQTLRCLADEPGHGRLLFDSGLPIDCFVTGLRAAMEADVAEGIRQGVFTVPDAAIATSMVTGALLGLALDLYRGLLPPSAIEPTTARLLELLGVGPSRAHDIAHAPVAFRTAPALPLRWLTTTPL
jgi:AcrR family transcriptional regulator